jgi:alpha-ribazole phosphatase
MELILLRHGATEGNLLHQYIGVTDSPLAAEGVAQAIALQGVIPVPELICSSPLRRCIQTAELIWPEQPIQCIQGLRETDFGAFEGKTWQELKDDAAYRAWIDGVGECPGGELRQAAADRMVVAGAVCLKLAQKRRVNRLAIVTHGGVIMELMTHHCGGQRYDWQPGLCSGWQVRVNAQGIWENPVKLSY